jgi:hypothetical protein
LKVVLVAQNLRTIFTFHGRFMRQEWRSYDSYGGSIQWFATPLGPALEDS